MIQEKAKKTTQRPKTGSDSTPLDFTVSGRKVPDIGSVLDEIDKVLAVAPKARVKEQRGCGC